MEVVLVGPTTTHWAQSRGRLQWTRNSADPHPYYDSLVSADSSSIRACWNQERQGEPRPQPRMTTLALKLHREDEVVGIGHCFEIITTAPWSAKLSTFAWRLVAGVLPVGKATGRKTAPEFDTPDDTCMLCDAQGAGDTIDRTRVRLLWHTPATPRLGQTRAGRNGRLGAAMGAWRAAPPRLRPQIQHTH